MKVGAIGSGASLDYCVEDGLFCVVLRLCIYPFLSARHRCINAKTALVIRW